MTQLPTMSLDPVQMARHADDEPLPPQQVFRSKVYRAEGADDWIVEPPRDKVLSVEKRVFKGPKAQQQALTFAYETFGNARFFAY